MPKMEHGWSSTHDVERKALHDFRNLVAELVLSAGLGDPQFTRYLADELCGKYETALKGS